MGGLKLSLRHVKDATSHRNNVGIDDKSYFEQDKGIVTLEYPYEAIPVPDNGRYRLHNEIDDCIVCDKCVKVCPVDCIEIDVIKSTEDIGLTSDGTMKRLYAARFDIDMAKCCFCGLCTTVCPTECLTMTKTYDFSEFNVSDMTYQFAEMTPEEVAEKQRLYDEKQKEKEAAKLRAAEAAQSKAIVTPPPAATETEAKATPDVTAEVPAPAKKPGLGFKIVMKKPASSNPDKPAEEKKEE